MTFLSSLGLAAIFVFACGRSLKKYAGVYYAIFAAISVGAVSAVWLNTAPSGFLSEYILPIFARGGLAGAFFMIVMITGALPNGSALIKRLMPVRGELSIIASILTLGHNFAYGKTYFLRLFSWNMPVTQSLAAICSLLMIVIMLPLFVTSFKKIRGKIDPKKWKKLQRFAYGFYALLCVHIMLLTVPQAIRGRIGYMLTVCLYGAVFLWYALCRVMKHRLIKSKKSKLLKRREMIIAVCCVLAGAFTFIIFEISANKPVKASENEIDSPSSAVSDGSDESTESTQTGGIYRDGIFTGTAFGNCSDITVKITLENDVITRIEIVSQGEDEPYFSDALAVIDEIISKNIADVDAVTGATYSSEGIIDAVKAALKSAEK